MQTVRTFRKLRAGWGGTGRGKEGKDTVLHMKLINTGGRGAWVLGRGSRQGSPSVPDLGPGAAAPGGETEVRNTQAVAPTEGSPNHSLRQDETSEPLLPLVPGPRVCRG